MHTLTTAPHRPPRSIARYALFGVVTGVLALAAYRPKEAALALPTHDAEVLASVPARSSAEVRAVEALRLRVAAHPGDVAAAVTLAQSYIEASRREGDPRQLGAAEAVLAPWWRRADAPASVILLRATILQSRHAFDAAQVDLDRVLAIEPDNAQAWLTRATVSMVQGQYERARESCAHLAGLVSASMLVGCIAPLDALTGRGESAWEALSQAIAQARSTDELAYLHSLAGEQAFWLEQLGDSERHLRAALALDAADRYSRALYADLLLDTGRPQQARALVAGRGADDALALRDALAALALAGNSQTADRSSAERVAEVFAASRLRGDSVHQREEARLMLARGDAEQALQLALQSWAVQQEPWDARLVLEAAVATRDRSSAGPVLAWLDQTHFEAPRLRTLASQLPAAP